MVLNNVSKFYPSQRLLNIIRIFLNVIDRPSENTRSNWGWEFAGTMARSSIIIFKIIFGPPDVGVVGLTIMVGLARMAKCGKIFWCPKYCRCVKY